MRLLGVPEERLEKQFYITMNIVLSPLTLLCPLSCPPPPPWNTRMKMKRLTVINVTRNFSFLLRPAMTSSYDL